MARTNPPYTLVSNLGVVFGNLWRRDRALLLTCVIRIPTVVATASMAIYLPKRIIELVNEGAGAVAWSPPLGLGLIALNAIERFTDARMIALSLPHRLRYTLAANAKAMDTDYENVESPRGQDMMLRVYNNRSSAHTIVASSTGLLVGLLGLLVFGSMVALVNPLIVALLVLSSAANYLALRAVSRYEFRNRDQWTPLDAKIHYLQSRIAQPANGKDIRIYGMGDWLLAMYRRFARERLDWTKRITWRRFLADMVNGLLLFLRDGVAYGILISQVTRGRLSLGDFVLYFGAVAGFSTWLSGIVNEFGAVNDASLRFCDVRQYVDMKDASNRRPGRPLPSGVGLPCSIEFRTVGFRYPGSDSLLFDGLNLSIQKGESVALVGENGAGKTTLVKLLCGLYRPTSGEILINGISVSEFNIHEYFTLFSVIFQEVRILPVSIQKDITMSSDGVDREWLATCLELSGLKPKVHSLENGADTLLVKTLHENAVELSGGEIQKLLLARALYRRAPIMILDEPTAALDPIAENELYLRYGQLTRDKTSVFISHRLSSTRFCVRIAFMGRGRIEEMGSHEELMRRSGDYAKMFEIQSHYYRSESIPWQRPSQE